MIAGEKRRQETKPKAVAMRNHSRLNLRLTGRQVLKGVWGRVKTRVFSVLTLPILVRSQYSTLYLGMAEYNLGSLPKLWVLEVQFFLVAKCRKYSTKHTLAASSNTVIKGAPAIGPTRLPVHIFLLLASSPLYTCVRF